MIFLFRSGRWFSDSGRPSRNFVLGGRSWAFRWHRSLVRAIRWPVVASISDKVGRFFDQRARTFHRIYEKTPFVERTFNRLMRRAIYARTQVLVDEVQRLPSPTLLDVGSGTGVNTFAALEAGASRAVGVDLAKTMVEMARQGASEHGIADKCQFDEGDFMTAGEEQRFDVVAALGVFDYVRDAEVFFRKMCRVANRTVVASFPGRGFRGQIRRVRYERQGCPLFLFDEEEVKSWAQAEGFKDISYPFRGSSGFVLAARR